MNIENLILSLDLHISMRPVENFSKKVCMRVDLSMVDPEAQKAVDESPALGYSVTLAALATAIGSVVMNLHMKTGRPVATLMKEFMEQASQSVGTARPRTGEHDSSSN